MSKNKFLIGIDIGTSSAKMTVINMGGDVIFQNNVTYDINYLPGGYVEQDPEQWYLSVVRLVKQFIFEIKPDDKVILAIGISSQSNALVPLNSSGMILHPAILYLDKRAIEICDMFSGSREEEKICDITGSNLKPSYTGPQISWMKKNNPDIYKNTQKFLTANGYINFKMTGTYSQDHTQTGMTGIFDRKKGNWSQKLLKYFGIDREKLPKVYRASDVIGKTNLEFKEDSGFPTGVPVIAGTLDVASTMLGSGCVNPGACFIEMGSVINITVLTEKIISDKNLQTYPSSVFGINIVAGSVDGAGNTIKWFLDEIYKGFQDNSETADKEIFNILEKQLAGTKIGADKLIFLPFMVGMRTPRSDLHTKGAFLGLKVSHKKIDIFRSILEGCSYGLKFNLEFILNKGLNLDAAIISGGSSKNNFWVQMIADTLDIPIKRSSYDSGASIGTAMLAGIGVGAFKSVKQAVEIVSRYNKDFLPSKKSTQEYFKYYMKYKGFMEDLILQLDKLERD